MEPGRVGTRLCPQLSPSLCDGGVGGGLDEGREGIRGCTAGGLALRWGGGGRGGPVAGGIRGGFEPGRRGNFGTGGAAGRRMGSLSSRLLLHELME